VQDEVNQGALSERFLALPPDATAPFKQSLLSTLGSPNLQVGGVAAQCVSAVAAIELPAQRWPELIQNLLEFVGNAENTGLRINTLQAVGYVCEVIVSSDSVSLYQKADFSSLLATRDSVRSI
jgi:importin subunit beta-1